MVKAWAGRTKPQWKAKLVLPLTCVQEALTACTTISEARRRAQVDQNPGSQGLRKLMSPLTAFWIPSAELARKAEGQGS